MRPHLALAAALSITACGGPDPREVTADDPDVARIAVENNAFTLDMHRAIVADSPANAFHSPFSMNAALSMTYAGARGDTATEMETVLHMEPGAEHHAPLGALVRDLSGDHRRDYTLEVANRIWAQQGRAWNEDFLAITADDYGAPTELTDIQGDPEGTRSTINGWVSDVTRDKIPELLPGGSLSPATVMVLVNAIYFKADWAKEFDKADTRSDPFTLMDGSTVDVDTMHAELDVALADAEGFSAAGLPYGDSADVRMWVLLPDADSDLTTLEASLQATALDELLDAASETEVMVALPKLELRTQVQLKPILSGLGMPTAFGNADFSGMLEGGGLYIDEVYHEAYVRIDEEGTEAAAATAVVMNESAAQDLVFFTVDRPYLFLIRDELSGAILFMGRVTEPGSDEGPL